MCLMLCRSFSLRSNVNMFIMCALKLGATGRVPQCTAALVNKGLLSYVYIRTAGQEFHIDGHMVVFEAMEVRTADHVRVVN